MLIIFFIAIFLGTVINFYFQYKDKKAGYDWMPRKEITYKIFEKFFYRYFIVFLACTSFAFLVPFTFTIMIALCPQLPQLNTVLYSIELLFFTGLCVLTDRFIINSFMSKKKSK